MALDLAPWSTACLDWEDRIREGRTLFPDLPLDPRTAGKALALFQRFRIPDMPGLPTFGERGADWQFELVEAIFGSLDPETRSRNVNEFFVLIPKKNAKTPTAAAIMLLALILNDRPEAEFYLISASHHIANYSFRTVKGIIAADADIKALFHVQDHLKRITHLETGAQLSIISADGEIVTGSKPSGILIDEMHVLGAKSKADHIMAELRGGFAARPEGFLLTITTQSKEPPSGQFKKELARARRVRDGEERAPLLPVLYEFPTQMVTGQAWRDPETWGMVNPNLDVSVSRSFLEEEFRKAQMDGPAALALFASLHLNVEIGVGLKGDGWVGADYWAGAGPGEDGAPLTGMAALEDLMARSEVCTVGIDGGGLDDLLGLSVAGRERGSNDWWFWFRAWAQSDVMERRKEIVPRLMDFAADGDLVILPPDRARDDIREIGDIVEMLHEAGLLPEKGAIGLDPQGVSALVDEMASRGIGDEQMAAIGQGYRLSPAIWGMERRLKMRAVRHYGQPMMDWVIGNAKTEQRGSAVIVTKEAAGKAKIDPLVAGFDAFVLMSRNPVAAALSAIRIPDDYEVF